ncbi:MAG: hypothetical protein PF961_09050 [Planctomycetota bacterium]|jgi:ActR/RegA family two-component response regulator|nr:hypothetical protein [Planctomycetota bacterium]
MASIRVLVAVPYDDEARKLASFFVTRGCKVDVDAEFSGAQAKLAAALEECFPFSLLIADERLQGGDGVGFLAAAHKNDPRTRCILLASASHVNGLLAQAKDLGIRHVLPKPLDFSQIQEIIDRMNGGTSGAGTGRHSTSSGDETPFFGTRRLAPGTARLSAGNITGEPTPSEPTPGDPFEAQARANQPQGYQRTKSSTFEPRPAGQGSSGTRSIASPTQRIRRGVTGRISNDQHDQKAKEHTARITKAAIQVRCAHCSQAFGVIRKQEMYTMPCIHCGGLNSIMP